MSTAGISLDLASLPLPARIRPATPMSDDKLLRFCSKNETLRIERESNGDLLIMTPTGGLTGRMNTRITRLLDEWAEGDGRGYAFESNTGFRLPDGSIRSPDASWVGKLRWDALTEKEQSGYAPLCPEFIVELTSPTDRLAAFRRKILKDWIPNGTDLAWLIDAKSRSVTVYRPEAEPETLFDPTSVQGSGPVRGFELVLTRIW